MCNLVGLGDTVYLLTIATVIREHLPDAVILGLVTGRSRGIWKKGRVFDRVEELDFSFLHLGRTYRQFRSIISEFPADVFIDTEQKLMVSSLLAMRSGAKTTTGFAVKKSVRGKAYSHPVVPLCDVHMLENYSNLIRTILPGLQNLKDLVRPDIEPGDVQVVDDKLADLRKCSSGYAVIHPGSGPSAPQRRWIPERFVAVALHLVERYGLRIVLTGVDSEKEITGRIADMCSVPVRDCAGWFSVGELAALLEQSAILVSVDTGVLHLGAALGIPVVGLFGPESPVRYRPISVKARSVYSGIECSPCINPFRNRGTRCRNAICMSKISVEDVTREIDKLLVPEWKPVSANVD